MDVVETQVWKIKSEDHDKLLRLMTEGDGGNTGIAFQKEHQDVFHYSLTRTFYTTDEEAGEETWVIFDEYPDEQAYADRWDRMNELPTTDSAGFVAQVQALQIPGSYQAHTVYKEMPELTNKID